MEFKLKADYSPTGDQPEAIKLLSSAISKGNPHQTLVGVTGSGKTYTIANVIQNTQLPTLIISHNKTLASQLYQEFRDFFPENAVSFFVSYYDYYQPEAYIPASDTYIEKEADINSEIDRLRLSTTANLVTRPDCIVVASVSCIYNLGSPLEYEKFFIELTPGQLIDREVIIRRLTDLQYTRTKADLVRGSFRVMGDTIQLFPSYEEVVISLTFKDKILSTIEQLDPYNFTNKIPPKNSLPTHTFTIYPAKHYLTNPKSQVKVIEVIISDLAKRVSELKSAGRILEAHRIEQKVNYDLAMIKEFGFVNGIENYSRYFDGRNPGDPPYTLLDYFHHNVKKFGKSNFLTVIDESHISLPQIRGMYNGDQARKETLIDYGFRLPAAIDNRPLNFTEFQARTPLTLYSSATPREYELNLCHTAKIPTIAHQYIRPTGLLDPDVEVRPTKNQISDLIKEITIRKVRGERTLILTLTKRTAEDLTEYLQDLEKAQIKVAYIHSDVTTLDRSDILDNLRLGTFDCLVGINLLREGLDLPEVSLIAILDADKEGFLRTPTALIQTMGRAARHVSGHVILYADRTSDSMKIAMDVTAKRREYQIKYNLEHHIDPQSINKPIREKLLTRDKKEKEKTIKELADFGWKTAEDIDPETFTPGDKKRLKTKLTKLMNEAAKNWDFESAARLRDSLLKLE